MRTKKRSSKKRSNYFHFGIIAVCLFFSCKTVQVQPTDIVYPVIAHSHNDYEQAYPLETALENGFGSIEIDVFLHNDEIVVSHDKKDLDQKPTITDLYFKPLHEKLSGTDTHIYLLVDIKIYVPNILKRIHEAVDVYADLFTIRDYKKSNLTVILSGAMPREELMKTSVFPYFFIDGRLSHVGKDFDSNRMPLISTNFSQLIDWDGERALTDDERLSLKETIVAVQAEGKMIRFWKTPDTRTCWDTLVDLGVDIIGVDHLELFRKEMNAFDSKL